MRKNGLNRQVSFNEEFREVGCKYRENPRNKLEDLGSQMHNEGSNLFLLTIMALSNYITVTFLPLLLECKLFHVREGPIHLIINSTYYNSRQIGFTKYLLND